MLRLFPDQAHSFCLSAGAPEAARNRKASAAVIDAAGNMLAFLKLAASDLATELLHREADMTSESLATTPGPADVVPRLLAAEEIDGTFVAAQAPSLAGRRRRPLRRCIGGSSISSRPARRCLRPKRNLVRDLPARIAALPQPHPELIAALDEAMASLAGQRIAVGAVHGDFAPWNLRLHNGRISAFDWEYGCLKALPASTKSIIAFRSVTCWTTGRSIGRLQELADAGRPRSLLLQARPPVPGGH